MVITGVGLVGAFGAGKEDFIRFLSHPVPSRAITEIDFDAYIDTSALRRADHISRCALTAATLALKDARIAVDKEKSDRVGILLGTTHGAMDYTLEYHTSLVCGDPKVASPLIFSESVVNAAMSHISTVVGIRGYATTTAGYCAVLQGMRLGIELVEQGALDVCLVGGADVNNDFLSKAYEGCLDQPELIKANFGGSGFIVLESLAHALRRQASIYARVDGVSIVTAGYHDARRYNISPLNDIFSETDAGLTEDDCALLTSFNDGESISRKELYSQTFINAHSVLVDQSSVVEYGFSAGEAFGLIAGIMSVYSADYLPNFKEFGRRTSPIERLFIVRTTLAGSNACAALSRWFPKSEAGEKRD